MREIGSDENEILVAEESCVEGVWIGLAYGRCWIISMASGVPSLLDRSGWLLERQSPR